MNKDVLVALIAKDVNELQTLTEGLDQMEAIPAPYLRLALDKSKALTANLDNLINYLNNKEIEDIFDKTTEILTKTDIDVVICNTSSCSVAFVVLPWTICSIFLR